jgi:hypothetical protein
MALIKKFLHRDEGLVTIEWVGIAAVMVIAAIGITAFVMEGADGVGGSVATGLDALAADVAGPDVDPPLTP